jgi:flagellar hook-associated protein 3 FlgL
MAMRISTAQMLNIDGMASRQAQLAKVQQQMSSGLKASAPADDPAAAVRVLDLESTIAKTNQYQNNISTANGRLNIEDSALLTSGNILDRAKELTIRGMNATLNSSDRLSLKVEVDQLIQEMAGVANTKNANGEFIFSGDLSTVPAFALNPTTGEYNYQGGPQQRALQIGPTRQVADGDLGFKVFENINSSSPAADENGKRSIFNTLKALSDGLGATFKASPGEITGARFLRYGLDYTNPLPATTFNLVANVQMLNPPSGPPTTASLPPAPINLSGKKFTDVAGIVTEINNQLAAPASLLPAAFVFPNTNLPAGSHFSDAIQAQSNGNRIEFVSVATGATSRISINNTSGTFLIDAGFQLSAQADGKNTQPAVSVFDFSGVAGPASLKIGGQTVTLNTNTTNEAGLIAAIQGQLTGIAVTGNGAGVLTFTNTGSTTAVAVSAVDVNAGTAGFINSLGTAGTAAVPTNATVPTKAGVDLPILPVQVFQKQLGDVLTDLDAAQSSFLEARTSVGVRLNALDDQKSQNEKFVLDTRTTLSETQNQDYAEAASRFQLQFTALQAAQLTFAKIKGLSLFNYL